MGPWGFDLSLTGGPGPQISHWAQPKVHMFLDLFWKAQENEKIGSQGSQKTTQLDFEIHKNDFGEKLICAIPSVRKPRILNPAS